ncbi:hypothetical protein M405DRAFT_928196 [Rhizopogon salebrosus TDB-379]|nr:hypothetical protein M405DRAFT_928196 [Rhizopogon salebrosus TDB-379]
MLSKSFVLFATFVAFAPAFAAPVTNDDPPIFIVGNQVDTPSSPAPTGSSDGNGDSIISLVNGVGNDINLRGLGAAGFRQRSDYSETIAAAEVAIISDIVERANVDILSQSKRGGGDPADVTAGITPRFGSLLGSVTGAVGSAGGAIVGGAGGLLHGAASGASELGADISAA